MLGLNAFRINGWRQEVIKRKEDRKGGCISNERKSICARR